MQLQWTDLAVKDLDQIEVYITSVSSQRVAIGVVVDVLDSLELVLPAHPRAGRIGRVKNTREWVVDSQPFIVIYRESVAAGCVEILRVLHETQEWPVSH